MFSSAVTQKDNFAGAALWLSSEVAAAVEDRGHIGNRLAWVRFKSNKGSVVCVAHYIAHAKRVNPDRNESYDDMETFLGTVLRKSANYYDV